MADNISNNWHSILNFRHIKYDDYNQRKILIALKRNIRPEIFFNAANYFGAYHTEIIKTTFVKLGLKEGFWVYANRMKELEKVFNKKQEKKRNKFKSREWMYDIHWYKDKDHYMPSFFPLAAECEWRYSRPEAKYKVSFSAVRYDFQKLLITNSDLKVLIFKSRSLFSSEFNELDLYFNDAIEAYPNLCPGSKFLFICFIKKEIFFCEKCSKIKLK